MGFEYNVISLCVVVFVCMPGRGESALGINFFQTPWPPATSAAEGHASMRTGSSGSQMGRPSKGSTATGELIVNSDSHINAKLGWQDH